MPDPTFGMVVAGETQRGVVQSLSLYGNPIVAWDDGDVWEHTPEKIRRQR